MKTLRDLKVGDVVLVTDSNRRQYGPDRQPLPPEPHPYRVAKVGRKLLHVQMHGWYTPVTFDLDSGHQTGEGVNTCHVYTAEQWEERDERAALTEGLRRYGLSLASWSTDSGRLEDIPIEKLRGILAILNG